MSQDHASTTGGYLRLLWRRKWQLVLPVLVATAVAYGVSAQQSPVFETHADLLFQGPGAGGAQGTSVDVPTEAQIVMSPQMALAAAESLGGDVTVAEVEAAVTAEPVETLPMLRVSARAPSAQRAEQLVTATVEAYLASRADRIEGQYEAALADANTRLEQLAAELDSVTSELAVAERVTGGEASDTLALRARRDQLVSRLALQQGRLDDLQAEAVETADDVSVLVPATIPTAPQSPQPVRAGAIGALIGLLLGFALMLLRQQLQDSVHDLDEVEEVLLAPVLTVVPRIRGRRKRGGVALHKAPTSPAAEAYRILRANLAAAGVGTQYRIVLITSAMEGEGKTTTAANLAIAFAETGEQVVLVDADLRRPKLHELLAVPNKAGLADVLRSDAPGVGSIAAVGSAAGRLGLVPAGSGRHEPVRTLSSARLGRMLTSLRESSIVIVDSPPALPVADAAILAGHADAVVLAVDITRSNRATLERLRSRLTAISTPVIGFVLHAARPEHSGYLGYRGYRGYEAAEPAKADPRHAVEPRSSTPRSSNS